MAIHALPARDHSLAQPPQPLGRFWRLVQFILGAIPTALVLAALAGIAFLGHRYEWKLPKYSEIFSGSAEGESEAAFCDEHAVTEEACIECNPKLAVKPTDFGW